MRFRSLIIALVTCLSVSGAVAAATFPDRIELPNGFQPEGIATGRGSTFYSGSLADGGIWRGDYRTGEGEVLVEVTPEVQGPFVGMTVDSLNRLWVAGGFSGNGYVFDAATGAHLETFSFATEATFVNDVVVTTDAAYFTDSFLGVIYRVDRADGTVTELDLTSVAPPAAGVFQLNGIDATPNGETLVAANSTEGELYAIDVETENVATIDLGETRLAGDGILLHGTTLYVVARNDVERIAVVELAPDLSGGTLVEELTSDDFDVPTTIARFGASLYAVNARFTTAPTEDTEYWITRLDR